MAQTDKAKQPKKPLPLWALLPLDAVLIAANLLTFAYFHHVNPIQKKQPDISAEYTSYTPPEHSRTRHTTAATTTTTSAGTTDSAASSDTNTTDGTEQTGTTSASAEQTGTTGHTDSTAGQTNGTTASTGSSTTTTSSTSATSAKLQPDLSGWGEKWPDKFSYDDTIIAEDRFYKSHDMNITVTQQQVGNSMTFVADIYLRYYDNFMSAVVHDDWVDRSQNAIASMPRLAGEVNAVLAVNGDFIAQRDTGIVVRGGQIRRNVEKGDIGCYYCDGTFRSILRDDFDLQTELNNMVYHTMTFSPILVQNSTALTDIRTSVSAAAPRTAFGYYEPGHYTLVVVDGRQEGYSVGMTIDELAAYMGSLGCKEAYNLDGGASSVMYFNGSVINKQSGSRGVSDIFYFGEVQ